MLGINYMYFVPQESRKFCGDTQAQTSCTTLPARTLLEIIRTNGFFLMAAESVDHLSGREMSFSSELCGEL